MQITQILQQLNDLKGMLLVPSLCFIIVDVTVTILITFKRQICDDVFSWKNPLLLVAEEVKYVKILEFWTFTSGGLVKLIDRWNEVYYFCSWNFQFQDKKIVDEQGDPTNQYWTCK